MWPFKKKENRAAASGDPQWLKDLIEGGSSSATGRKVTADTAMQASAVYACIRILAETVASLPLNVYKRLQPTGKEKAINHNLYSVLHDAPNPEITSLEFREAMQAHLCLRGNAYAEKVFDGAGRLRQLWPISPDRVSVERDRITKQLVYTVTLPESAGQVRLTTKNMFHLRGLSGDGIVGYSPIKLFKESIGLSLAAEEYGARFFGNSLRPSGVFEHPNKLGKQAQDNLVKSMQEQHQELSKKFRVMVLEEGMKWHQMSISPEEAQFLQTRQFQVVDIARIFRVPPHLIAELSRATFSNIEQQSIDFVVNTIRPWLVRWEQAIKQRLFDTDEIEYFAEFVVDGLLRGDIASRYTAYSVGRQNGWLSADDIRDLENMNPLPNGQGKTYLLPLNMVPADQSAKVGDMAKDKGLQDDKKKQRTSNAFRRIFQDALTRIVKRERADVLRQIKKYAQRQSIKDFETWLDDFYSEHVDFIKRNISPVITSYYEIVESTGIDLDERINDYTLRHIYSSKKQIRGIVNSSGVDLEKALTDMFDVWEGQRMIEVAAKEIAITGAVND